MGSCLLRGSRIRPKQNGSFTRQLTNKNKTRASNVYKPLENTYNVLFHVVPKFHHRTLTLTFPIYTPNPILSLSSLLSRSINPSCLFPFSSVSLSQIPSFSRDREFHAISRKFHLPLFLICNL